MSVPANHLKPTAECDNQFHDFVVAWGGNWPGLPAKHAQIPPKSRKKFSSTRVASVSADSPTNSAAKS
jgi:hypothetical protein